MATKRLYRSRHGKIFGVATGFAEWRDLNPEIVRPIFFIIVLMLNAPGIIIYLALALFLPLNPEIDEHTVYGEYEDVEEKSTDELKEEYERLKKKVEDMESSMFDKERDWDNRFYEDKK